MSAPPRKAAKAQSRPQRAPRSRSRAKQRGAPARPQPVGEGAAGLVPATSSAVRHHHEADEAASAAAVGAALIGPFVIAGAIGLRILRQLTRRPR
jgi:hypothetical protein